MTTVITLHLLTIIPVLLTGPFIFFRIKGDATHKVAGKVWAILMIVSCLISFGIRPRGWSWLHGLAAFTIFSVVKAIYAVKKGNLRAHRRSMIGSYCGALVAFCFALRPERILGGWAWSWIKFLTD